MANFKKDNTKVQTFSASPIRETGLYECTIAKCYDRKSMYPGSDSAAIHFEVVTRAGQYGQFDLWWKSKSGETTDKNGKDLPALQSINDLQVLLELDEINSKPGKVMIYDFDSKQYVEQKKMVYHDLIDKQIGIIFEAKQQPKNQFIGGQWVKTDEFRTVLDFRQFFDAETNKSASEFLNNSDPVGCERYLNSLLADKQAPKQAEAQPSKPLPDNAIDDFDDGIPF